MIKKLLFASMLAIFFVVSAMAQHNYKHSHDLFIGTTDSLYFEWCHGHGDAPNGTTRDGSGNVTQVDGFLWNSNNGTDLSANTRDSVGAVTYGGPLEGGTHYEFYYDFNDYWASGAWALKNNNPYGGPLYLTKYTHLKLYWKGKSVAYPNMGFTFQMTEKAPSTGDGVGKSVTVCDNADTTLGYEYREKLIPLDSFMGAWTGQVWTNGVPSDVAHDLSSRDSIHHIGFSMSNNSGEAGQALFYIDAIQLIDASEGIVVEGNYRSVIPGDTFNFPNVNIHWASPSPTVFKISNVKSPAETLTFSGPPVISGTDASLFTVNTTSLSSIAPGTPGTTIGTFNSETFTITFHPTDTLVKTATLTIPNSFTASPFVINLKGKGDTVSVASGLFTSKRSAGSDTYEAYPTPFSDETVIKVNSTLHAPVSIKVMDTKGTVVSTSESHFTNENISIGKGLEKGIYFVQATYQDRMQIIKIVKM